MTHLYDLTNVQPCELSSRRVNKAVDSLAYKHAAINFYISGDVDGHGATSWMPSKAEEVRGSHIKSEDIPEDDS